MKLAQFFDDMIQSYVQGVDVICSEYNSHFAKSCEARTFDIDLIHDFETRVELYCNLVAFRKAHLPIDFLMM